MPLSYLDGKSIYYAFNAGAHEVIKQKNALNKINVFPIADGDTGSNLAITMNSIMESAKVYDSAKETLKSISDSALVGARGNSGIIFAQFINGLAIEVGDEDRIPLWNFGSLVNKAVPYAYEAIFNPTEGTMITVMKEWAEELYSLQNKATDFAELLTLSLQTALDALNDTPNKLKVLKDFQVVDSGAKGFVHFLDGFVGFITHGKIIEFQEAINTSSAALSTSVNHYPESEIAFRYCTEALLSGKELDTEIIKASLSCLGDSLVVAGNKSKMRVHMHTNAPEEMIYKLKSLGTILQQKADDMQRQSEVLNKRHSNIALVTDSIADLPQEIVDKYQIHLIPLNILIDGTNYLDKLTVKVNKFYQMADMSKEYPTSSLPSLGSIESLFSYLTNYYDSVIAITVSKELSGTFTAFQKSADKFNASGKKISVINSRLNSGAQGLLVLKAAEIIETGMAHDEIIRAIESYISQIKIYVSVNTLKYMVRSGRITAVKGIMAKLLNLKPVVSLDADGKGIAFGKAYSIRGNIKLILKQIKEIQNTGRIIKYAVVHSGDLDKAKSYSDIFSRLIGFAPEYITEISSIVAMSSGKGCVAISLMLE